MIVVFIAITISDALILDMLHEVFYLIIYRIVLILTGLFFLILTIRKKKFIRGSYVDSLILLIIVVIILTELVSNMLLPNR